jgi:hypothetical protein
VGELQNLGEGFNPTFRYVAQPNQAAVLFCEYDNRWGDRYRVELPLRWTQNGYEPSHPERFFPVAPATSGA